MKITVPMLDAVSSIVSSLEEVLNDTQELKFTMVVEVEGRKVELTRDPGEELAIEFLD